MSVPSIKIIRQESEIQPDPVPVEMLSLEGMQAKRMELAGRINDLISRFHTPHPGIGEQTFALPFDAARTDEGRPPVFAVCKNLTVISDDPHLLIDYFVPIGLKPNWSKVTQIIMPSGLLALETLPEADELRELESRLDQIHDPRERVASVAVELANILEFSHSLAIIEHNAGSPASN